MTKPRKRRESSKPELDPAAIDTLLGDRKSAEEVEELFRQMKKALMERILAGELTHHLGYGPGEPKPAAQPNARNGTTPKTVLTDDGAVPLAIPRDRAGSFEPQLIPKHARRLPRFDQNVLSLYARGMTVREIREHLEDALPGAGGAGLHQCGDRRGDGGGHRLATAAPRALLSGRDL